MAVKSYKDLKVWQAGIALATEVYKLTTELRKKGAVWPNISNATSRGKYAC